jgi:nucleoid-associated protein YgaU
MKRDVKIGMLLGLFLALGLGIWLASRPQMSLSSAPVEAAGKASSGETVRLGTEVPRSDSVSAAVPGERASAQAQAVKTTRFHIVGRNETLSEIARKYYGSSKDWQRIYRANRERVEAPEKLKAGTKLTIPD